MQWYVVISIFITGLVVGFGVGNYIDDLFAKVNGRVVLSNDEYDNCAKSKTHNSNKTLNVKLRNALKECKSEQKTGTVETNLNVMDRECVGVSPMELLNQFDSYNTEANDRLFKDHYFKKYVCEPWRMKVSSKPEVNSYGFWSITGTIYSDDSDHSYDYLTVWLPISVGSANLNENDLIAITGYLVSADSIRIEMRGASYELLPNKP